MGNANKILVGELERKKPSVRGEDNIKANL